MMKWIITYYSSKVFLSIERMPTKLRARYLALTDTMIERGPLLGMPHTRALGEGLFELRVKAQEGIARVFYCVQVKQEIVVLHSFVKKTQQTPDKELKLAKKRLQEVKKNG